MQEQAETEARKRLESQKAETEAKKEAHRKKVEAGLPPEPPLDQGDNITKIRVRLPKGEYIERRFQAHTPLKVRFASTDRYRFCNFYTFIFQVLLDFLIVKGYPTEEYKVISSWPRRDVSTFFVF